LIVRDMVASLVRRVWSRGKYGNSMRANEFGGFRGVVRALMSEGRKNGSFGVNERVF